MATKKRLHQRKLNEYILLLELDHPPANTISKAMKEQFMALLSEITQSSSLRVLIITGRGDKFCCGDDLKEATQNATREGGTIQNLKAFSAVIDQLEALPIPIIAAINGWCVGGGLELALCCDIRMAAKEAKFISAGVNVGLMASAYRLPRLIGIGRAKRLLLTGETIDAQQALDFGLITDIYDKENLLAKAIELATLIATKAPLAIKTTKKVANSALDMSPSEGHVFQQGLLEELSHTQDHQEALLAFKEKRQAIFKGK